MARKVGGRVKKSLFDPTLAILGGPPATKYVSQANLEAAKKIALNNVTRRIREPVNAAGVKSISDSKVIYGLFHTEICKPVTLQTLTTRLGIADTIDPWTAKPKQKVTPADLQRGRKFTEMHKHMLDSRDGPFEDH